MKKIAQKSKRKTLKMASFLKALELSAGAWDSRDYKEDTAKSIRSLREFKR